MDKPNYAEAQASLCMEDNSSGIRGRNNTVAWVADSLTAMFITAYKAIYGRQLVPELVPAPSLPYW
jgi:hypothetical protein